MDRLFIQYSAIYNNDGKNSSQIRLISVPITDWTLKRLENIG